MSSQGTIDPHLKTEVTSTRLEQFKLYNSRAESIRKRVQTRAQWVPVVAIAFAAFLINASTAATQYLRAIESIVIGLSLLMGTLLPYLFLCKKSLIHLIADYHKAALEAERLYPFSEPLMSSSATDDHEFTVDLNHLTYTIASLAAVVQFGVIKLLLLFAHDVNVQLYNLEIAATSVVTGWIVLHLEQSFDRSSIRELIYYLRNYGRRPFGSNNLNGCLYPYWVILSARLTKALDDEKVIGFSHSALFYIHGMIIAAGALTLLSLLGQMHLIEYGRAFMNTPYLGSSIAITFIIAVVVAMFVIPILFLISKAIFKSYVRLRFSLLNNTMNYRRVIWPERQFRSAKSNFEKTLLWIILRCPIHKT